MRKSFLAAFLAVGGLLAISGCGSSSTSTGFIPFVPAEVSTATWVANGTNVLEFNPTQFTTGVADTAPEETINSAAFTSPQGVQFDSSGDLWVIDGGNNSVAPALFFFSATQLANLSTAPNPNPAVTIQSAGFVFPQQAVFQGGNLVVTDNGADAVFIFSAAQLLSGGTNVTPVATFDSSAFDGPLGLAFGANGNLWVANNASTTLVEFDANTLPTTGTVNLTPNVILSTNNGSIEAPWGLIFDGGGDLFSSNANSPNTLVEFAHSQLATTGAPVPALTISPVSVGGVQSLDSPNGIAFDSVGDLLAANSVGSFGIPLYSPNQLLSGGALTPESFLVGATTTLNAPAGITIGPFVP